MIKRPITETQDDSRNSPFEPDDSNASPQIRHTEINPDERPITETQGDISTSPFKPDDSNASPQIRHTELEPGEPNASPQIRPTELETNNQWIIPASSYAPEYRPGRREAFQGEFAHLNCFQFTPYEQFELPPTITLLKQHAKALCLLLHLLQPSPPGIGPYSWPKEVFKPPFEWLQDLESPYVPEGLPAEEWGVGLLDLCNTRQPKTPGIENRPTAELIRDANIVLTTLHFAIQPKHSSLLSLNLASPQKHPVLAEWISFTHKLRNRVVAFKEEVRFLTETLVSEAVVPVAQGKELRRANAPESYSLEYPTDRYVLAGLSEGLWNRLTEELKGKERDEWWDRKEELAARQGVPKFDLIDDSDDDDDIDIDIDKANDEPRVTWIETTSRLYTVKGMEQHIFVIPGFGAGQGNMTLHREQEEWLPGKHERFMELVNERISELAREESELRQEVENERSGHGMLC